MGKIELAGNAPPVALALSGMVVETLRTGRVTTVAGLGAGIAPQGIETALDGVREAVREGVRIVSVAIGSGDVPVATTRLAELIEALADVPFEGETVTLAVLAGDVGPAGAAVAFACNVVAARSGAAFLPFIGEAGPLAERALAGMLGAGRMPRLDAEGRYPMRTAFEDRVVDHLIGAGEAMGDVGAVLDEIERRHTHARGIFRALRIATLGRVAHASS